MDPKFNPWAAPSAETTNAGSVTGVSHLLPIEFRVSIFTKVFMLPIGVLMVMMTISAAYAAGGLLDESIPGVVVAFYGIAFATAATAYGCLLPMRCKIVLTETSIQKTEFFLHVITYSQIESWHHHPVTGTVNILLYGDTDYVAISNWAMSREKSEILGRVLHEKIGPPRG